MEIRLPAILLLAILSSGCLQGPATEERLACLELTSYAFTSIPKCETQDACFAAVQNSFPHDERLFSAATRQETLSAKNHLARAWLFLNRAKANLKNIHDMCYSSSYSGIPREVNELNSSLREIGAEIDEFNSAAARSINAELASMSLDDINAISGEPLFDDYAVLNRNVVDFSQQNAGGATYASRFLREAEKFREIAETLELQETLQETTLFGIVSENQRTITDNLLADAAEERDFPIWLVGPVFSGVSDFLRDFFALGGSVSSLESLPSFDVLSSINSLIGSENSAAAEFFAVFRSDSEHRALLDSKNKQARGLADTEIGLLETRFAEISESLNAFLVRAPGLNIAGVGGFEEFRVSETDPRNFGPAYSARILAVKSALASLDSGRFLGTISLGEGTAMLAEITAELAAISAEMEYFGRLSGSAMAACSETLDAAEEKITSAEFESTQPSVVSLKARVLAGISVFRESGRPADCASALSGFERLEAYIRSGNPEAEAAALLAACISESGTLAAHVPRGELTEQLAALTALQAPFPDAELVLDSCLGINSRLLSAARSGAAASSAEEKFSGLSRRISFLNAFTLNFPGLAAESRARQLSGRFAEIAGNFDGQSLKAGAFQALPGILPELEGLNSDAGEAMRSASSEAVEKYASIEYPGNYAGLASGGRPAATQSVAVISFSNIPAEMPLPFTSVMGIRADRAESVFSTGNISFAPDAGKTLLRFTGLLPGINSIALDLNALAPVPAGRTQDSNSAAAREAERIISENRSILANSSSFPEGRREDLEFMSGKIEFLARQNMLGEAGAALAELKASYAAGEAEAAESSRLAAEFFNAKLLRIDSLKSSLAKTVSEMLRNFGQLGPEGLAEISGFIPITKQRAEELSKIVGGEPLGRAGFSASFANRDFAGAMRAAQGSDADSIIAALDAANSEASNALAKMRENALSSYELASRKSGALGDAQKSLLMESRQALEGGSYLESLLASNSSLSAMASLGAPASGGLDIPLPVYPLALVAIAGAFYVWKKRAQPEPPPQPSKVRSAAEEKPPEPELF